MAPQTAQTWIDTDIYRYVQIYADGFRWGARGAARGRARRPRPWSHLAGHRGAAGAPQTPATASRRTCPRPRVGTNGSKRSSLGAVRGALGAVRPREQAGAGRGGPSAVVAPFRLEAAPAESVARLRPARRPARPQPHAPPLDDAEGRPGAPQSGPCEGGAVRAPREGVGDHEVVFVGGLDDGVKRHARALGAVVLGVAEQHGTGSTTRHSKRGARAAGRSGQAGRGGAETSHASDSAWPCHPATNSTGTSQRCRRFARATDCGTAAWPGGRRRPRGVSAREPSRESGARFHGRGRAGRGGAGRGGGGVKMAPRAGHLREVGHEDDSRGARRERVGHLDGRAARREPLSRIGGGGAGSRDGGGLGEGGTARRRKLRSKDGGQ